MVPYAETKGGTIISAPRVTARTDSARLIDWSLRNRLAASLILYHQTKWSIPSVINGKPEPYGQWIAALVCLVGHNDGGRHAVPLMNPTGAVTPPLYRAERELGPAMGTDGRHGAKGVNGGGDIEIRGDLAASHSEMRGRATHLDADEPVTSHQDIEVLIAHRAHRHDSTHQKPLAGDPEAEPGQLASCNPDVAETGSTRHPRPRLTSGTEPREVAELIRTNGGGNGASSRAAWVGPAGGEPMAQRPNQALRHRR